MTKAEFFNHLNAQIAAHPIIAKSARKTFNELCYVLRMDKDYDYNISVKDTTAKSPWTCIPSVKECFIPVRDLKKHVKSIEFDEDDYGCEEICITVVLEK